MEHNMELIIIASGLVAIAAEVVLFRTILGV
jgi:peroxiredoxin family protein